MTDCVDDVADGGGSRRILPADTRIAAARPAELVQNVRNMLVAEGHLPARPVVERAPSPAAGYICGISGCVVG
jgi:hypothetical protein